MTEWQTDIHWYTAANQLWTVAGPQANHDTAKLHTKQRRCRFRHGIWT